ncbi:hypothetical protein CW362_31535 [Streptomyces populi]|uniref:HEAT repeat domain-containing protein n=1 Tax=Streptomyces populi TaxID=2058924 RepID=A0A2I0SGK9_9ACTN|nr:hypothetical protein [Streptomyces populi]PKT69070.1 hypothetical protein CW362_31535 [Streptomyces populi]
MTRDEYVRELIARAKDGAIPQSEVKEITQVISQGAAGHDLYRLLYAVARAGGPAYENLVAGYLIYPQNPEVSALAVQVLTGHWRVGAKYQRQILELLGSPDWDISDDAFLAAISGAGEILHDGFDAELLHSLLNLAEEGRGEYDDDLMQRLAVEAIARALGLSQAESMKPPANMTRLEWSRRLLRTARDRLESASQT